MVGPMRPRVHLTVRAVRINTARTMRPRVHLTVRAVRINGDRNIRGRLHLRAARIQSNNGQTVSVNNCQNRDRIRETIRTATDGRYR